MNFPLPHNRKFYLLFLLVVFLIYCAYSSRTCFSSQFRRSRKFIGTIFLDSSSSLNIIPSKDLLNESSASASLVHRTRTCANELNQRPVSSKWPSELGNRRLPKVLIIGVKKSGTRALLEFIRLHPDVRASSCEVHFFDRHYNKGLRWYRRRMPPTKDTQLTMEKTPSYFITREVPKRVYNMNPKTKLLLVVRDPVTRATSDYTQARTKQMTTRRFEELAFVNGTGTGVVNTKWGPLRIGLYCRHLSRWLQYFPLSQFLFISGERLISEPAQELQRVEAFLQLRPVITANDFFFNTTKGFPCIWRNTRPHCLGKTKGRSHPTIDAAAIDRLRQFYRPFNRRFYEMTGMDFGWP